MKAMNMHRRTWLQLGFSAIGASIAASLAPREGAADESDPSKIVRADHVIMLWLNGGPSHIDTFDLRLCPGRSVSATC